ncbi:MAG TPA: 3-keto-5-aminohexanoate cleavage protein [Syntrophobacteraceae bacterium]|nr:3-keto-5-aminohexanoate cleavage protein [Syntrophobacteraceae bacterium]
MYYTDDSLFPEKMQPLIITVAPFGPQWVPGDADIPVSWDEQVQAAVDCYNAGATMLHVHVRDPKTGKGSVDFEQFNYFLGRLRQAVPKMILQVGGSISFAPKTDEAKAKWLDNDTRHMLAELEPKPEFVTVAIGTTLWDVVSMMTEDDIKGTHLADPKVQAAWAGMVAEAGPAFYLEHLKRLREHRIQPYFVPAHVHQLEIIERLIRKGVYMGPMNLAIAGYGGGTLGRNPFDWMEMVRRVPQGSIPTFWSSMRGLISLSAMAMVLGLHIRVGNEDNLWGADRRRKTSVQQVEGVVRLCKEFGRKVATAEEARKIMKVGVWYNSVEETLQNLGLPPNREGDAKGLLVWDTTAKKTAAPMAGDSHPIEY